MEKQGGHYASKNGSVLENAVEDRLIRQGYKFLKVSDYKVSICLNQPIIFAFIFFHFLY